MTPEFGMTENPRVAVRWRLRDATEEERGVLFALHRSAMRSYVEATWGLWDDSWQADHFFEPFSAARWCVIEVNRAIAGMVSWEETPDEIFLASIEIHPEFQRRGIGTAVVQSLAEDARAVGKPLTLRVLRANERARRLYERLGFEPVQDTETHAYLRLSYE